MGAHRQLGLPGRPQLVFTGDALPISSDFPRLNGYHRASLVCEERCDFEPTVSLADEAVELQLKATNSETRFTFTTQLDDATDLSLGLSGVSLGYNCGKGEPAVEVHGLVDGERSELRYGIARFALASARANQVLSIKLAETALPLFGHEFNVTASALPVKGLLAGYCPPSLRHDIWIGTERTSRPGGFEMLFAAEGAADPGKGPFRVVSEVVCRGCGDPNKPAGISYFATRLHRSDDLMNLQVEFYNFELQDKGKVKKLKPLDVPGPCLAIVILTPQHLSEDAYLEGAGCEGETPGPSATPIGARSASATRLVFEYPKSLGPLELNDESILDWSEWLPRSSGVSRHPDLIAPPEWDEPAIEAPRGLVLQQGPDTHWRTKAYDSASGGRHVLFNIDLVPNEPLDASEPDLIRRPRVVPVWTDAFVECGVIPDKNNTTFWRSLCRRINLGSVASGTCEVLSPSAQDTGVSNANPVDVIQETTLRAIVRLSHDLTLCPEPPKANHMLLSQLGAWAELEGFWPKTKVRARYTDVKSWQHRMTQGRTQFDKVERRGFLYPFGHRLTLIEETNRRQHEIGDATFAVLKKKWYVVVEQPEIVLTPPRLLQGALDESFRMPFRKVRIVEASTPNLDPPAIGKITETNACNTYFWGTLCKEQFFFNMVGTDWRGREIEFNAPLLFANDVAIDGGDEAAEGMALNSSLANIFADRQRHIDETTGENVSRLSRSFADLAGQVVALQEGYQVGDTDFEVGRVRFKGEAQLPPSTDGLDDCDLIVDLPTENTAFFYPAVEVAEARAPTLSKATAAGGGACWLSITDPQTDGNTFEIMAVKHADAKSAAATPPQIIADANAGTYPDLRFQLPFDANSDSTGGVSGPTPKIDAWSRLKGPLGIGTEARASLSGGSFTPESLTAFRSGKLSPGEFFDLDARILGVIPLSEIIAVLGLDTTTPTLLDFFTSGGDIEDSTGYAYDWDTPLEPWDSGILKFGPRKEGKSQLTISGGVYIELETPPKIAGFISGKITNFRVTLEVAGNGIQVDFLQISLHAPLGEKVQFDVDIDSVTFIGPLMEFVQKLKKSLGFGNGFDIVLSPTSVTAQLGPFELPGIGFGVFSMSQISFFAACDIYFRGNKPILFTFNFSTLAMPFTLAVALLGGRGHFHIALDTSGIQEIAASLEFGAITEFNFGGFAHGNLYVMGGMFYNSKRLLVPSSKNTAIMVSETVITVIIYVRAGGSLSCFGFITVSLDVHLGLAIAKRGGNTVAYGTATLSFSVKIGFFKKSFSVTFSKELPGSNSSASAQRIQAANGFAEIANFQLSLSPASPDTPFSSFLPEGNDPKGLEASPAQITEGLVYAAPCDHVGDTCGPSGMSAMSKAQFRYYWYAFGENRKTRY